MAVRRYRKQAPYGGRVREYGGRKIDRTDARQASEADARFMAEIQAFNEQAGEIGRESLAWIDAFLEADADEWEAANR